MEVPDFTVKLNNRKVLSRFVATVAGDANVDDIIRLIDKSDKISEDEFVESMKTYGLEKRKITKLLSFMESDKKQTNAEILKWLRGFSFGEEFSSGVDELEQVINLLKKFYIDDDKVKISMGLARGLSYYTGSVFETTLNDIKDIGSIAAGGRYDNLTSLMSDKRIPGVGASIGVTRLLTKLFEIGHIKCDKMSTAQLLVTVQNRDFIGSYMSLSNKFRQLGINTETYLQDKPLGAQLSYASKKGINYVLIANEMELLEDKAIIRNLMTKEQKVIRTASIGKEELKFLK
jgi:histidyl-tRNA synthetase